MKINNTRLAVAALALLSSVSVAAAANNMSKTSSATTGSASSMARTADTLSLSTKQQQTAWQQISKFGVKQKAPSGFTAAVGAAVPSGMTTNPVPVTAANKVPKLRPYRYALLDGKLLIVNPTDKKIAEVISK